MSKILMVLERHKITYVFALHFLLLIHLTGFSQKYKADVIIYGGTSAAVTAAVQVKKMGKSVIIVSPDKHLGGLSSGGLGYTDSGDKTVIGGLSKEFYHRLFQHYQKSEAWVWQKKNEFGNKGQGTVALDSESGTMWLFEPSIAEMIFEQFISENQIPVFRNELIQRDNEGVQKKQNKIISFKTLSGKTFAGEMFIDVTYEGDLMAEAGISYSVGREANNQYDENWNGVQTNVRHHGHTFTSKIDPYIVKGDPKSGLLPEISEQPSGEYGTGDQRLQAYCFRMCMSNHPENRVPFPKPENYDATRYELLKRVLESGWNEVFNKFDMLPNRKTDTNNHGPFSSDYIGKNYDYPEASYERRTEIIKDHELYQKGYLYFLQNDPSVPKEIHDKMQEWGLAKDEFLDNGHWPHQLYIREARRMIGEFVMTEADALGKTNIKRAIGMGSYSLDSHNAQRYVTEEGYTQNEGDVGVRPDRPYAIDYGAIVPKESECSNLLVPVCVSSTHIAFGSIRMEPVFMILGQSAATAAVLALELKMSAQKIPYEALRERLLKDNQVLKIKNLTTE
jgi:hypothetical protein